MVHKKIFPPHKQNFVYFLIFILFVIMRTKQNYVPTPHTKFCIQNNIFIAIIYILFIFAIVYRVLLSVQPVSLNNMETLQYLNFKIFLAMMLMYVLGLLQLFTFYEHFMIIDHLNFRETILKLYDLNFGFYCLCYTLTGKIHSTFLNTINSEIQGLKCSLHKIA